MLRSSVGALRLCDLCLRHEGPWILEMARTVVALCGRKGALYMGICSTFYIMTLAKGMRYSKIHL
jgi:hypothetical protein